MSHFVCRSPKRDGLLCPSSPFLPLTDSTSSWFIGIAIKNATGDTPFDAEKTVTLTLTRSFDYSYTYPMGVSQGAICVLCGLTVSLWAWCIFRECICSQCSAKAEAEPLLKMRVTWCDFFSPWGQDHLITRTLIPDFGVINFVVFCRSQKEDTEPFKCNCVPPM